MKFLSSKKECFEKIEEAIETYMLKINIFVILQRESNFCVHLVPYFYDEKAEDM